MSNIYIQEPPTSGKVVMKTTVGDLDLELWTKEAPKACRNFIQLCMEGYYNNTVFHRVVKGFIVQGGDPTGTGEGGESIYGAPFKDEFHSRLRFCRRGLLAMANAGKDDNGSQFFFTLAATPELQNKHTIFGKITGETVFNMIKLEDALVDQDDRPVYPQKILKTEIINNPFEDIVPRVLPGKNKSEEKKKKKEKKRVEDLKLLSFGEEVEEDLEELVVINKKFSGKSKSAHDNLEDPKLSSQTIIETKTKNSDSETEDLEKDKEDKVDEKEKREAAERIRNKLKSSGTSSKFTKANTPSTKGSNKIADDKNDDSEEEYYFGKDRDIERQKETERIKKEIRDLKRGMRNEENKKLQEDKQKAEEKKNKEVKSESVNEYNDEKEKYKTGSSKVPKKGASRDESTQQLLNKFLSSIRTNKEHQPEKSSDEVVEDDDDDDPNDTSWMTHTLRCQEKAPVLAKDASTKGDDWFEIYDPRNPINKRRRGEDGDKSKKKR